MLKETTRPRKDTIWFRYDPPVLIVTITWHQTPVGFGRLLHTQLALTYFNDESSVSYLRLLTEPTRLPFHL